MAHDELGDDGGEEPGDDEAGSAGCFGDEHHTGERDAVSRAEKCSDADHAEQRGVERVKGAADDPTSADYLGP